MLRLALAWRWNGHVIHIEGGGVAMIPRCVHCSTAAYRRSKVHEGGEIRARLHAPGRPSGWYINNQGRHVERDWLSWLQKTLLEKKLLDI